MFTSLPKTSDAFSRLTWSEIAPWYNELASSVLSAENVQTWLAQWSGLCALTDEALVRFEIATTCNTDDVKEAKRKQEFLENVYIHIQSADQQAKEQLLASNLQPEGFAIPLRDLRADTTIFRESNLPLQSKDKLLADTYMEIRGTQMVEWEGKELPITALYSILHDPNRQRREQAWRTMASRELEDREKIDDIWVKQMELRQQIARNVGVESFRDYRWQQMHRFDYTPDDCKRFHAAVEQVIVPAASKILEKHRQALSVERLRPWDRFVNHRASEPPREVTDVPALLHQCLPVYERIDPQLKTYFETMLQENLLDLEERPAKAPGGYNLPLEVVHLPFIFGHVNSISEAVPLIFHESGHAFHVFESAHLPYVQQRWEKAVPIEFAEVASTSMEYIGALHLHTSGLCTKQEESLIRIQHLEQTLTFLPSIILSDAFQHWLYEHPEEALHTERVDEKWAELNQRYQPEIDWSGFEDVLRSGWHSTLHFFTDPFYYIEYAFATVGALQVWRNYVRDPQAALQHYRHALSLGATRTLPELYKEAGANFHFDSEVLHDITRLVVDAIGELEKELRSI